MRACATLPTLNAKTVIKMSTEASIAGPYVESHCFGWLELERKLVFI